MQSLTSWRIVSFHIHYLVAQWNQSRTTYMFGIGPPLPSSSSEIPVIVICCCIIRSIGDKSLSDGGEKTECHLGLNTVAFLSPTSIRYSFAVLIKSRNVDLIQLTGSVDTRGHVLVDWKTLFYLTTSITPHSDCFVWRQAGRSDRRNCSVSWIGIHAF